MTQLLHPHETDAVSTLQESGWDSEPAWIGLVNLTPPEFELLTLQSIWSSYIYYAIPPPLRRKPSNIKSSSCWLQLLPTQTLILCWSWLSVKLSSIPSRLCPLHANFLFSLSSNPLPPHHSIFFLWPFCLAFSLDLVITNCFGTFLLFILSICPHCLKLSNFLKFYVFPF